ncbi:sugar ABC transporter permease [Vallitalea longa]|uniref:Sugar ABC transporter permease n=1 Tax=Vallitalea longa TaxID=2936439 RepID=A0A9W5YAP7_9FIRM|nr:carbohydrate ABC transporter permease [Vallitalea longa]GKX28913.1 sugar ABC transporter permease [Vallitalea longa]
MNARKSKGDIIFDTINVVILTIILIIVAYPLIYVVSASISDPTAILNGQLRLLPKGFTLEAYKRVLQNKDILMGYKNTIIYTVIGTLVNIILTIMIAYPLSRKDMRGRNFIMAILTFTMFFSGGLIPTYLIIKDLGLINNFWVMILPNAISMYNVIIVRTFFQNSIPMEIQEASMIDGCSNIKILMKIILPLSKPIMAVMVLYYGIAHWNAFFNALIYLSDKEKHPLQLILRDILIQNEMNDMMNMTSESVAQQQLFSESLKYAVIVFASLPVLIIYPILQRHFVKGVMVGALKG